MFSLSRQIIARTKAAYKLVIVLIISTMKTKAPWVPVLFSIMIFLTACKKDISLPDPILKRLFGTWEWVESTGGINGDKMTPASVAYTKTIEIEETGILKKFKNGKKIEKLTFTLAQGPTIHSSTPGYLLKYADKSPGRESFSWIQSIEFGGRDTLYLNDQCYDCYKHLYIRKK
jgi:hypothetical protein